VQLLSSVVDALSAGLDLRQLVQQVAELVTGVAGSDVCFVHLLDEQRHRIVLVGATPPFDTLAGTIELGLGEGVAGWVALHGRPAIVPDKWSDPRYRYIPALRGEDFSSLVSIPMIRRGTRVIGVLNLHSRSPRTYSAEDLALMSDLANLLAGAIENASLYEQLEEREGAIEHFAAQVVDAQEAERRRLAGDIHDGISQRLVGLAYHLEAASSASALGHLHLLGEELAAARRLSEQALEEAREAIAGLRPSVLDDLGLGPSLESLARGIPGVAITVKIDPCRLASHVETALYRIAQEALQNIVKHSAATTASIELRKTESQLRLLISDNGEGFDLSARPLAEHFGLTGIAERAELVGGSLELRSAPGRGTVVDVVLQGQPPRAPLARAKT